MDRFIDRRLDGGKSTVNRQRLAKRITQQIREAVIKSISDRGIANTDNEKEREKVNIPARDLSEPVLVHGSGGRREVVHPGNREFVTGDQIARPPNGGGSGSGSGQAGNSGRGEDDFVFEMLREEVNKLLFEGLELPYLAKTPIVTMVEFKPERVGFSTSGSPNSINLVRSYRQLIPRRNAMTKESRRRLVVIDQQLFDAADDGDYNQVIKFFDASQELRAYIRSVQGLDPFDLRYRTNAQRSQPTTQAVVFLLMDVSGSMDRARKDIAKVFFSILCRFLKRNYEKFEVVFVRHDTTAEEVSEKVFFFDTKNGGTEVSCGIKKVADIIKERYPPSSWNIYVAQASDGDNWGNDSPKCTKLLLERIMPFVRYYVYIEVVSDKHQNLWEEYKKVEEIYRRRFAMQQIGELKDIYPVFRDLFKRRVN